MAGKVDYELASCYHLAPSLLAPLASCYSTNIPTHFQPQGLHLFWFLCLKTLLTILHDFSSTSLASLWNVTSSVRISLTILQNPHSPTLGDSCPFKSALFFPHSTCHHLMVYIFTCLFVNCLSRLEYTIQEGRDFFYSIDCYTPDFRRHALHIANAWQLLVE